MQKVIYCCKVCWLFLLATSFCAIAKSQQVPVNITLSSSGIKVSVRQELNFGAFTQGPTGGSVNISQAGTRYATGAVVPLNFGGAYTPLVLEIEGPKGAIITMLTDEKTILTGSNGGVMRLRLKESDPPMPFIITEDAPARSIVTIGAELIVGSISESPPGNYNGSLNISFVVE